MTIAMLMKNTLQAARQISQHVAAVYDRRWIHGINATVTDRRYNPLNSLASFLAVAMVLRCSLAVNSGCRL